MRSYAERTVYGLDVEIEYVVERGRPARLTGHGLARPADGTEIVVLSVCGVHPGWDGDGLPLLDFAAGMNDAQVDRATAALVGKEAGEKVPKEAVLEVIAAFSDRDPFAVLADAVADEPENAFGYGLRF